MVVSDGKVLNRKLKLIASPMDNLLKDSPQYWRILANGSLAISFILMLSIVFTQYSNIRERERRQKHQACLISKLEKALGKVRMLSGLLSICASCKKIKDDKGYWNKIVLETPASSLMKFDCGTKNFS